MKRLMVPLPAASRPSNKMTTRWPVSFTQACNSAAPPAGGTFCASWWRGASGACGDSRPRANRVPAHRQDGMLGIVAPRTLAPPRPSSSSSTWRRISRSSAEALHQRATRPRARLRPCLRAPAGRSNARAAFARGLGGFGLGLARHGIGSELFQRIAPAHGARAPGRVLCSTHHGKRRHGQKQRQRQPTQRRL